MSERGRYYSARDRRLVNSVNAELLRDVIETLVTCFKVAIGETTTNVYGESSSATGISFYPGVELTALIERNDPSSDDENFGPDRDQTVIFKLRENSCRDASYFPEIGDIIVFNDKFHEVDNVVREQLLGGQPGKSHSFILNTHYSRISKLNIISR
jgi:hypothetical protein